MVEVHCEDVDSVIGFDSDFLSSWYQKAAHEFEFTVGDINVILCSDEFLLDLNKTHLDHDYYTDIITFDYCEPPVLSGDLFISVDRVKDNAADLNIPFVDELHRVSIHGFLHLCGLSDKSPEDVLKMRSSEDAMLLLR